MGQSTVPALCFSLDKRKGRKVNPLFLLLQTDFVGDLGKMGIKYRMLDMAGLEKLKESLPEEPCKNM